MSNAKMVRQAVMSSERERKPPRLPPPIVAAGSVPLSTAELPGSLEEMCGVTVGISSKMWLETQIAVPMHTYS